jgi:hypothetical protein
LEAIKASLPDEPEKGDPNACEIVFRLPGTAGVRVTRRFRKDEQVKVMYGYIESIRDTIQFESPGAQFTIM